MSKENVSRAVELVLSGSPAVFKFIAANETGETGGHQCGYYVPRDFAELVLGEPCRKGQNLSAPITLWWNDVMTTASRVIYYGKDTRNEARITTFGRGFEYLKSEYTGAIVVFILESSNVGRAFVFNSEDEMSGFMDGLGLGVTDANRIIKNEGVTHEERESEAFRSFIASLSGGFPTTEEMSATARAIENAVYNHQEFITENPDEKLISWNAVEYRLFRAVETHELKDVVAKGFGTVDAFLARANAVLNRRKSRAGKGLEHHLAAIFTGNNLSFGEQIVTEGNKRPDFIFPSAKAYHDSTFCDDKLVFLAAKTSCKDRWRQVLVEADRFRGKTKFLCTLQAGMSSRQMDDMMAEKIVLVVPKPYIKAYPIEKRKSIMTLSQFVAFVRTTQMSV